MNLLGIPAVLLALLLAIDDKPAPKAADVDYEAKLNEILSAGIGPENNANVLLWKAFGPKPEGGTGMPAEYFKRLGIPTPPDEGDYFIAIDRYLRDQLKLEQEEILAVYDQQGWSTKQPWTAKDYPRIAAWLKLNEKPLAVVIEAVKRPHYFNPIVGTRSEKGERGMLIGSLLPNVQKGRELAAALTARAMLRIEEGKSDEAWQDILAAHRLGRLTTHGGTLIQSLVGIAIGAVANNATLAYLDRVKLTPKQLAEHMKDLEALPPRQAMGDTLDRGERYMGLDSLQHIRRGGQGGRDVTPDELKGLAILDWDTAFQIVASSYDTMAAAARIRDRTARETAFGKLEQDLETRVKDAKKDRDALKKNQADAATIAARNIANTLMGLLAPAVRKLQSAYDRADQLDRNLQVAFALAAYRADNGRYPAKLDDLAPRYLAAVPTDIFTGKPLIYKPTDTGYLLYSVGANGKDEDGRWYDDEPAGDDPRVRMPLPPLKKDK